MPFNEGILFYEKAVEEKQNEQLYLRWISGYQSQVSFEEFKRELGAVSTQRSHSKQLTEEEIYKKVSNILRKE